jgi:lipid A 3-O-deacylase
MSLLRFGRKKLAPLLLLTAISPVSHAIDSVSLELAKNNNTRMVGVSLQQDWSRRWFDSGNTYLGGYWNLSLARWHATQYQNVAGATQNITDIGITPVFRFQAQNRLGWYAEGGIGAHLLSALYDSGGKRLSTSFQFGDLIGIGYVFQNRLDVGVKVEHYSNGGIKHPNDGVNFVGVTARYRF